MGVRSTAWPYEPDTETEASESVRPERDDVDPSKDDREAAVQRVLASASFAKANRLSTFLEYVCRLALEGREAEINELNIGINVFERREDYNASDDTIVRTTARGLRQRLKSYYEGEGTTDSVRIDIPKGTYVPTFVTVIVEPPQASIESLALPDTAEVYPADRPPIPKLPRLVLLVIAVLLAFAFGVAMTLLWLSPKRYIPWLRTPSDKLWALVFPADHSTYIVPADTTLLRYELRTRKLVPLNEYIGGNFFIPPNEFPPNLPETVQRYSQRYTAVTSVQMAEEFGRIQKPAPDRTSVRFARDMQMGDLNQSNAILIGAAQNNPWVQLFRNQTNFHLDWVAEENRWRIRNDHPEGQEPSEWAWSDDSARTSYSHIALVHNLSGNGYVLILAGTNMFGSEAGSDFVFNPEKMNPILRKALRSDGSLGTFELLLQSNTIGTGTINTQVAAARFHP